MEKGFNVVSHIVFDHDGTLVDTSGHPKKMFEGINSLLKDLKQRGLKLYIWTARDRKSTQEILKNLEISSIFEDISTATDCTPKPNPDGLETMLFGVSPSQVLMIGDSYTDMMGAQEFGCKSIGVLWDDPNNQDRLDSLKHYGADHICLAVDECKNLINKLI